MIAFTSSVTLGATTALTLRCTASSTEGNFLDINFTAVRVGTLTAT